MASESFNLILDGRIFEAVKLLYEATFGMWFITGLFMLFKTLILIRTRSFALSFTTSMLYMGAVTTTTMLTGSAEEFIGSSAFIFVFTIMVFELAGILYQLIWKK